MSFKDYAPYIEGVIPAFDSSKIIVPFEHNPVVPYEAVVGLQIQIKNLNSTTTLVATVETTGMPEKGQPAVFETPIGDLRVGQWYNIQMAYILKNENEAGAYSAEAVTKYIGMPSITTKGDNINSIQIVYADQSLTEPVDTYELTAKTEAGTVIAATGPRTHDASLDKVEYNTNGDAMVRTANLEPWSLYSVPQDSTKVYVNYKITTHNLYEATGQFTYSVPQSGNEVSNIKSLTVSMSDEDKCTGVVNIIVNAKSLDTGEEYTAASYKLLRSEDKGFIWDEIARFSTSGGTEFNFSIQDWTVAHGTTYKYAVVQYNSNGVYSQRMESDYITAEFEHMFLCDATRSLCIKFNPKVSSFKETILESKSDTIGGKYPFFFRNGETRYKEIPIQGLISYWMDDKEQFIKRSALGLANGSITRPETKTPEDLGNIPTTNLVDYNIAAERIMKLEVLEWLNNGQPKLFRSPTEGNYLLRLMNVSLSPDDKLSRMIHSFSATGYEIGEPNAIGLQSEGIIDIETDHPATLVYESQIIQMAGEKVEIIPNGTIQLANFTGFTPGTEVVYGEYSYIIGVTGALSIEAPADKITVSSVGKVDYAYAPIGEPDDFNNTIAVVTKDHIKTITSTDDALPDDAIYIECWVEGNAYRLNGYEYIVTDGFNHVSLIDVEVTSLEPIGDTTITVHYQTKEIIKDEESNA